MKKKEKEKYIFDFGGRDAYDCKCKIDPVKKKKKEKKRKYWRNFNMNFTLDCADAQICLFPLYTQYYSPGIKFL